MGKERYEEPVFPYWSHHKGDLVHDTRAYLKEMENMAKTLVHKRINRQAEWAINVPAACGETLPRNRTVVHWGKVTCKKCLSKKPVK